MDTQQTEHWTSSANALFGPARVARVPADELRTALARMDFSRAIEALRTYREVRPFRGFFLDKYLEEYAKTDAADSDGTDAAGSSAARAAADREYWAQLAGRVEDEQREEWRLFRELPRAAVAAARERGAELGIGILDRDRGFRLLAIDMYYGANRENWEGPNAQWQTANTTPRKPAADDTDGWRLRAITEIERLRAKLRSIQIKYGEVIDVA